jgi:hypothetical protein
MRILLRSSLVVATTFLAACSSTPSLSAVYGTWRLVEHQEDSTTTHSDGETLQLVPGAVARFTAPGVESRQVRFSTFRGRIEYPAPEQEPEGLLMEIEGESEIFVVTMPTRNTLQLTANGVSALALTYHRVR